MKELFKNALTCKVALAWLGMRSSEEAWHQCDRVDWMLSEMRQIGYKNEKGIRLFACMCVRQTPLGDGRVVWDLLDDVRSKKAVDVAEKFAHGIATSAELLAAECGAYSTQQAPIYTSPASLGRYANLVAYASAAAAAAASTYEIYAECAASWASAASARHPYSEDIVAMLAYWAATSRPSDTSAYSEAYLASEDSDASIAARKWQADKLREMVPWSEVKNLL